MHYTKFRIYCSGCEPDPCTLPSSTEGYIIEDGTDLSYDNFNVSVRCDWDGGWSRQRADSHPIAERCNNPGEPYNLSGCLNTGATNMNSIRPVCVKPSSSSQK